MKSSDNQKPLIHKIFRLAGLLLTLLVISNHITLELWEASCLGVGSVMLIGGWE